MYRLEEVDGSLAAEVLHSQNALEPKFPPLSEDHLETGWWYLLKTDTGILCGFCGLTPFEPFTGVGYCKRAYVSPDHRGRGLQLRMLETRIQKARELGWHQLVSETTSKFAARNFERAGFVRVEPEQFWAGDALYYSLLLTKAA